MANEDKNLRLSITIIALAALLAACCLAEGVYDMESEIVKVRGID